MMFSLSKLLRSRSPLHSVVKITIGMNRLQTLLCKDLLPPISLRVAHNFRLWRPISFGH